MPQTMEIEQASGAGTGHTGDDGGLTEMLNTNLTISATKEIFKIDTSICRPPKTVHAGLYKKNALRELRVDTPLSDGALIEENPPTPPIRNKGVPGFPDFPDHWVGDEGWATWRRIPPKTSNLVQRRQRAEDIQNAHRSMVLRRFQRQAVNVAGMPKHHARTTASYKPATKTKAHKMDRRRKMLHQLRHRREMLALRKSMKALNCK